MTERLSYGEIAPNGVKALSGVYDYIMLSGLPKLLLLLLLLFICESHR